MQIHRTGEDYSKFYETKIKEYWDWKAEVDGTREKSGKRDVFEGEEVDGGLSSTCWIIHKL
jgi:hypothetical protein